MGVIQNGFCCTNMKSKAVVTLHFEGLTVKITCFHRKAFKMQSYNSVTLHVSPNTTISVVAKKIKPKNIQIVLERFFLSGVVIKLVNFLVFERIS